MNERRKITAIQESITAENVAFIQKTPFQAWNILRALKNHMAPSDMARSYEIRTKYHKLSKGAGNRDLEAWIDDWQTTCMDATSYGLAEVTGTRPVEDFLMAMYTREPNFTSACMVQLKQGTQFELADLLENFRVFIRIQKNTPSS